MDTPGSTAAPFSCTRCGREIGLESHAVVDAVVDGGKIVCVTCQAAATPSLTLSDIRTASKRLKAANDRADRAAQRQAMAFVVLRDTITHPDFNLEILRCEGSRCGLAKDSVALVDELFAALDRAAEKPADTGAPLHPVTAP
jgi:transcription elongation factor Elf1